MRASPGAPRGRPQSSIVEAASGAGGRGSASSAATARRGVVGVVLTDSILDQLRVRVVRAPDRGVVQRQSRGAQDGDLSLGEGQIDQRLVPRRLGCLAGRPPRPDRLADHPRPSTGVRLDEVGDRGDDRAGFRPSSRMSTSRAAASRSRSRHAGPRATAPAGPPSPARPLRGRPRRTRDAVDELGGRGVVERLMSEPVHVLSPSRSCARVPRCAVGLGVLGRPRGIDSG